MDLITHAKPKDEFIMIWIYLAYYSKDPIQELIAVRIENRNPIQEEKTFIKL